MNLETATLAQKVMYVKGRLFAAGKGEKLVKDERVKMFFHVLDAAENDLTGPKTIDAVCYWLDNGED